MHWHYSLGPGSNRCFYFVYIDIERVFFDIHITFGSLRTGSPLGTCGTDRTLRPLRALQSLWPLLALRTRCPCRTLGASRTSRPGRTLWSNRPLWTGGSIRDIKRRVEGGRA